MGRPPLFLIRVHTSLTAHALNRMDKIVGEKGRSEFMRKAIDRYLDAVEEGAALRVEKAKDGE